ncbi:MAG TPA: hypothetical protein VM509_06620 [Planctomycetota bacterium]|nr:hypothetical protein [Planctomycetota bacterium]
MRFDFHDSSFSRAALSVFAGLALACAAAQDARAQEAPISTELALVYDSGYASNQTTSEQVVIAFPVHVDNASWLRLHFRSVELAGDPLQGTGSILRITSLYDADAQTMNATHVEQWQQTSCYLNGGDLLVEVVAQPWTGNNRVVLSAATVGLPLGPDSQCGPTDDRILSFDGRAARLLPIGCTGWMIDDCRTCFLTAGHCGTSSLQTVQFNVPLSTAGGTLVNPPAADQYAVDNASKKTNSGGTGVGDDWTYFGCFPNSNTGLTPFGKQLVRHHFAQAPTFNASESIRITGYGTDSGSSNQVQQTHSGPWVTLSGTTIQYKTDTTGGNSGSPVIHDRNGDAIGIHTHGMCSTNGTGQNSGTRSNHPGLLAALAAPAGVCAGSGACSGVGTNFCIPGPLFSVLSGTGSASIASNNLVLHANNVGVGKPGLFMYSLNKQNVPFAGTTGRLCIGGGAPIVRLPPLDTGTGTTLTFAVNYVTVPPAGPISAGSVYNFQAWFRTTPGSSETSNGLTIAFVP